MKYLVCLSSHAPHLHICSNEHCINKTWLLSSAPSFTSCSGDSLTLHLSVCWNHGLIPYTLQTYTRMLMPLIKTQLMEDRSKRLSIPLFLLSDILHGPWKGYESQLPTLAYLSSSLFHISLFSVPHAYFLKSCPYANHTCISCWLGSTFWASSLLPQVLTIVTIIGRRNKMTIKNCFHSSTNKLFLARIY